MTYRSMKMLAPMTEATVALVAENVEDLTPVS
jgi:hypothetical protein